jgi:cytochrome P450
MRMIPTVPIEDPHWYLDDPWPTFAAMQREAPFWYYEPLDTFVVTRYEDIKAIAGRPEIFVNSRALFLNDIRFQAQMGDVTMTDRFFPEGGEQVGTTDPPRHGELRRVIAPAFSHEALAELAKPIRQYVDELLDSIQPGETVDWITYARLVPIFAGAHLIGVPDVDVDRVRFWSDELEKLGGDLTYEEVEQAATEMQGLQRFLAEAVEAKRGTVGGQDLISVLLAEELDGQRVSEANILMFCMTMIAAGSDTTRALLAGLLQQLAKQPGLWKQLRADRSLVRLAVEETLRWVTPARAFVRTATEDAVINGHALRAGQHLYLMYMAANRDERMFARPQDFDVRRPESVRHLAFGSGAHLCAAARLVRLEAPIVLNALLDRFSGVTLSEEPTPVVHIIRNGWSAMPAAFVGQRSRLTTHPSN